jgi:hypothetical protein
VKAAARLSGLTRYSSGFWCDGSFLIIDRVGRVDFVGVRYHTGEVLSVYLIDVNIEKVVEFLSLKGD